MQHMMKICLGRKLISEEENAYVTSGAIYI